MCGLSLAWVTSENSTMLLESDILRLFFTGPYLMLPRFSARCLVLTAPPWIHANFSYAACLSALQPPTPSASLLSNYQLLSWVASSTLVRLPVPLPGTARFHVQESFVWFRAKTDSSALAAYPHSATLESVRVRVAVPVGDKMLEWEPAPDRGLGPSVTPDWAAQPECERSVAMIRRTWGQYVAVCPRLQLTYHTQSTSTLSNKVWEVYLSVFVLFSKITKIPNPSLPGMTSFTPQSNFVSGVFIMTFVIVTSSVRAREH